ncbi:MAG: oligopeptidase A [Candidatus Pelagadaptatus aseana]|uniref:oligopeptidase A n=1 Tax=Candidatus Pelagadaptatus aseana TaxID=3120508 RepID=UPI0039B2BB0A
MSTANPLLNDSELPLFTAIQAEHVEPALDQLLQDCRDHLVRTLAANSDASSWSSLVQPLEQQDNILNKAWSPVSHMNSVVNSDALRDAYTNSLGKLTEYGTEVGQNRELYDAYQRLADSDGFKDLNVAQQTAVNNALRDFKLAGVALPEQQKQQFAKIKKRLSELGTQFANNVLDATQGWYKQLDSAEQLAGLPEDQLALAAQAAQQKQETGYVVTLDIPSYLAVMTYADNRELRAEIYRAYSTRASEQEPNPGKWDNQPVMEEILQLRHELSQLLGFNNYAERSLATKMAEDCDQVESFLVDLAEKSKPIAQRELQELADFAQQQGFAGELQAWDIPYYSEKLKQQTYAISQEQLRPYFPVDRVVSGLFEIVNRLFGIQVVEGQADSWHPDVRFFDVKRDGGRIASFYLDLYARENKRGGAWMDVCRDRCQVSGEQQLPVAYLVCNFTPAVGHKPALLTHNEVVTLFHEFGHGLHHMLTQINVAAVSGISGVAWDAVELPSQFLENWCWEPAALALISGHFESGEALPQDMLDNLLAAKNFQSALQMLRQIEFALFDFRLHRNYQPQTFESVQQVLDQVRSEVAVVQPPAFNRFQNGFSHIFAGGYAAGYYSYKWAEVLSSDAFARFEEEGVFNGDTGRDFLNTILEQGGSREAMVLFENFRGRKPSVDALLRHSGIQN